MPSRLTDIQVKRVSFVDKAAVRDPDDLTQARRFLLLKADDNPQKGPTTMSDNTDLAPKEQECLEGAMTLLGHCQHPQAQALYTKIAAIAHPSGEERVMKAVEGEVVALRKADPSLSAVEAKQRVLRENPKLQRELSDAMHGLAA